MTQIQHLSAICQRICRDFISPLSSLPILAWHPESAIEQAQNLTYNQTDALKAQLASTQSTKEYKKDRVKAMDSAVSNMSPWYSFGDHRQMTNSRCCKIQK
jgi:hypothetical protein